MTKKNKLIFRLLANPQSLRYFEIQTLLLSLGFSKDHCKGSHVKFTHPLTKPLVFPVHHGDCKPFYKRQAAKQIKYLTDLGIWP